MFPPTWNYLHRGNPPIKPGYAKYFLMTYLNYVMGDLDEEPLSKKNIGVYV